MDSATYFFKVDAKTYCDVCYKKGGFSNGVKSKKTDDSKCQSQNCIAGTPTISPPLTP